MSKAGIRKILGSIALFIAAGATADAAPIRFAVAAEPYPPFSIRQADGHWEGFEIDLIHSLCAEMKAQCEIDAIAWDGIIPALQANKVDVIFASMSITDERLKQIDFSHAYYDTPVAVAAPKTPKLIMTPVGLKGKTIGVQVSTVSANYLKKYYEKVSTIRYYDTQDSVNADLLAGRIDLMLADATAISAFVKAPEAKDAGIVSQGTLPHDPLFGRGVGAGMRKGDTALRTRLDKAIDQLLASSAYKQMAGKYFDIDVRPAQ